MNHEEDRINNKTAARLAASQILYTYAFSPESFNMEQSLKDIAQHYTSQDICLNDKLLNSVLSITMQQMDSIDQMIKQYMRDSSSFDSMNLATLGILRAGIAELQWVDTPAKVVINEYTKIAHGILCEKDAHFVNSILDGVFKSNQKINATEN